MDEINSDDFIKQEQEMESRRTNVKQKLDSSSGRLSRIPGRINPTRNPYVHVIYKAFRKAKPGAEKYLDYAKEHHIDIHDYSGYLDTVFTSSTGATIFTVLTFNRRNEKNEPQFRRINIDDGDVQAFEEIEPPTDLEIPEYYLEK